MGKRFPNDGHTLGQYRMHDNHVGLTTAVHRCWRALRSIRSEFDAIYVTGHSGIIPGSVCAWRLKKDLIILRKEGEQSHGERVEGAAQFNAPRYVIVDDFVSQGGTLANLLMRRPIGGSKLVAVCLYGHPRSSSEIREGYAKQFKWSEPITGGHRVHEVTLRRRNPQSILFDMTMEEVGTSVKVIETAARPPLSTAEREDTAAKFMTEIERIYGYPSKYIVASKNVLA